MQRKVKNMKITIEIDEKEIVEGLVEAAIELDKETVKRMLRGLITEAVLSLNAPTMHQIVDKFIAIEHEINYRASSEREG
jgi:hypothetical protein